MRSQVLVTASGAAVKVYDEGEGRLALLISGLGGTAAFWASQRKALSDAGYRVVSFDQPGCGDAPLWQGPVSIDLLAQITAEVLAHTAPEVPPALICGHSTGGVIAQSYLLQRCGPAPERLILSGTWAKACPYMQALFDFRIRSLGSDLSADMSHYARLTWLLGVSPGDVTEVPRPDPEYHDPAQAAVQVSRINALLAYDGLEQLSELTLPVTILGAADDRIVPVYHQQDLARRLPKARLEVLPSGGHFFPRSRADFVNSLLISG